MKNDRIERMRSRLIKYINNIDVILEKLINEKKYSRVAVVLNNHIKELVQMSMITYRVDKEYLESINYIKGAQNVIPKMQSLQHQIEKLNKKDIGIEPANNIGIEYLLDLILIALLNKDSKLLDEVSGIYNSNVVSDEGIFPFAQQYTPLLLMGALDQKEAFEIAYKKFKELKKSYFEEGLSLYIDMLNAIISRNQNLFDELHLEAEVAMQRHATDKKWGDDMMTGGHEYNAIAYDYRGTAMCCLAKMRGMSVNHFSCFYPREIIEL